MRTAPSGARLAERRFFRGELKHEVGWEAADIAANGKIEVLGLDAAHLCWIGIQHDVFSPDHVNSGSDVLKTNTSVE